MRSSKTEVAWYLGPQVIVRGDEVVSLGWCFWHWGCFGCLVCGGKLCVPGDEDVLERGLETVSRFDGGLSRDRLSILSKETTALRNLRGT